MITYQETLEITKTIISDLFDIPKENINEDDDLRFDLQLDSLDSVDLICMFEQNYLKREINTDEENEFTNVMQCSVKDLAELFYHLLKEEEEANESDS